MQIVFHATGQEAIPSLIPRPSWTEAGKFKRQKHQICNWTYSTILETLAHHAPDPGIQPQ
jgi:hypothetical protein